MAAKSRSNEIRIVRVYDAPIKAVWEAWTDVKKVAKWWGPRGFTLTSHKKELKPGGIWHYTMHGPDGVDYPNKTVYLEVEKYARLVYDHGGYDDRPPLFRVTVTFSENKGKTTMEMSMILPTPEAAAETHQFIKKANGYSTWDRLAEYLEKEDTGKEKFVINRTFETPLATMFKMWTDPEHFVRWLPPIGFNMKFIKADIREGGATIYSMSNDAGLTMYGSAKYLEIKSPGHLKYTQQFNDEHGNVSRHPMVPTWPETMLTTVTLAAEGDNHTRVTVQWEPYGKVTAEELAAFVAMKAGMTMGWTGSFDKLENYLAG